MFFQENDRKYSLINDGKILEILSINIIYKFCFEENYYFNVKNIYNLACQAYQIMLLTCQFISLNPPSGKILTSKLNKIITEKLKSNQKFEESKDFIRNSISNLFNSIKNLLQ